MSDWFEAEQRIERAQELSESRRWAEALSELDAALEVNPENASWHAHRGYVLDQLERVGDAIAAYEHSLKLHSDDVDVATALGIDLIRAGDYTRAVDVFADLARRNPDYEPAYCHRIAAYAELGQHDSAEEMFYLAQHLDEDCPHCFGNIGASLAARGQYKQAISCWQKVLAIEPDAIGIHQRIAEAHRAMGNIERAREYYLSEIRNDPGNTDLLYELGELLCESGDLGAAEAKLRYVIELEPDHLAAHCLLAEVLLKSEQPATALEMLDAAAQLDDTVPGLELRRGEALLLLGKEAEALPNLESALAADPGSPQALVATGNCLLRLGRAREATELFLRAEAAGDDNAYLQHNLAVCYSVLGSDDEALLHFLRSAELSPDFALSVHRAVVTCMRLRRWSQARRLIRRARARAPSSPSLAQLSRRLWRYRLRQWLSRPLGARGKKR